MSCNTSDARRRGARPIAVLAALLATAALAVACGSGDAGPDEGAASETTAVTVDTATPTPGGSLVYGIEADTASPWTPAKAVCAISCHMVMSSVYDPLARYGPDGTVTPHLLASIESNDTYTEWTLTPREGVTFHDGTPFDAAAVKRNLDEHRASFITSSALRNVTDIQVTPDNSSVIVTMAEPWARFPSVLTGQVGYQASPTWLDAAATDPSLELRPVGTGAFKYSAYEAGASFVAVKNDEYWRRSEGLPYLDRIEFRVMVDTSARTAALLAGDLDATHVSDGASLKRMREASGISVVDKGAYGETVFTMIMADDPDSHMHDPRIRRAFAHAINNQVMIDRHQAGIGLPANGPFNPTQTGYLEDSGYPAYDPERAKELVEEYKEETGVDSVDVTWLVTSDPTVMGPSELLQQFAAQVGINVELAQIEQSQLILRALQGDFETLAFRSHGGIDPDGQRIWWHSENAAPVGELSLNFARIRDDVIDAELDNVRRNPEDDDVQAAAEAINRRFGEQVYFLWHYWPTWVVGHQPEVHGVNAADPEGEVVNGIAGAHDPATLWVET